MGHVLNQNDRQGYVWDGRPISATKFEVFQKQSLSQEEKQSLVSTSPINLSITPVQEDDNRFQIAIIGESGYTAMREVPPSKVGYVKLARQDTKEYVVTRYLPVPRGLFVKGAFVYGGHHLGIFSRSFTYATDSRNRGKVIVYRQKHNFEFSGWGVGHVMFEDRQAWAWEGREINKTDFDLFWLDHLTPEEKKHLIVL
jgi:hypothetical protein